MVDDEIVVHDSLLESTGDIGLTGFRVRRMSPSFFEEAGGILCFLHFYPLRFSTRLEISGNTW